VGDGPERKPLAAELGRRGLTRPVELLGERGDVRELLAEADVFVLASRSEGLPIFIP
jgi:glycosyltransferase involved in cell wall biosynthesis